MAGAILRVSVLADGSLLLDGNATTLPGLSAALQSARPGDVVWYYREDAAANGTPVALEVMKLIVGRRLPVRLSTKPDFSDTVAPPAGVAQAFAPVRQRAAQRQLVIVRPDGRQMTLPALAKDQAPASAVAAVERMLPPSVQRNVAAIVDTAWAMTEKPNLSDAGRAVPFFGLLMGFASIGHAVWLFEAATAPALVAGCCEADVVIVDSARLPTLPENWQTLAQAVVRNEQILVHDRATNQLRKA
jgi:hypothetical protein